MGVKVGQLYQELTIDDSKFNKKIDSAQSKSSKLAGMLKTGLATAAAVGAAAIGTALAGAATKGIKEFMNYENQMNEVFTLMPEASKEMQKQMSEDMKQFSEDMGVVTNEATPALYQAISAGVPKDNVFAFLEQAQKASVGAITDLETSVDALSSVVNTYGTENISAAETSDLLFTAVKQGKTTFGELANNISDVAPIASSLNIEFSNITAALSTMTSQGTPTTRATTQLKSAMSELSKEGSKAGTAFEDVAGKSFAEFIDQGGNLQEAMALMEEAAEKNGTTVANMFGSIEAGQAALALTGKGAEKFKTDLEEMENSAGATEKAYEQMDTSLSRSFDKIKASANVLFIEIGERLRPVVADLASWIQGNMPQIKEITLSVFDAIVNSIYIAKDAYDTIKEAVMAFFKDNKSSLDGIYKDYKEIFDLIVKIIMEFVDLATEFWEKYGEDITEKAKVFFDLLKGVFEDKLAIIKDALQAVLALMKGDWEGFGEELGQMMTKAFEMVRDLIVGAWQNLIKPALDTLIENIVEHWKEVPEKIKEVGGDVVKGFKDGITGKAEDAVTAVKDFGGSIVSGFKGLLESKSPSKVFMRIGEDIVNGLTIGIGNKSDDPNKEMINLFENLTGNNTETKSGEKSKLETSVFAQKGQEKGQEFGKEFTFGVLNTIDLMTPTQAAVSGQKQVLEKERKKQEKEMAEMLKRAKDRAEERFRTKVDYEKQWNSKLIEQKADEFQLLEMQKRRDIARAEEVGAQTWAIKEYYAQKEAELIEEQEARQTASYEARFGFIKEGFGDAFKSILDGTESVTGAFENLWKSVLDEVMSRLAKMAASKVFNWIISGGSGGFFSNLFGGIFHNGGVVPGPLGEERLILAKSGETVTPPGSNPRSNGSGGGYGTANIIINLDGRTIARVVKQPLVDLIRITGGARF